MRRSLLIGLDGHRPVLFRPNRHPEFSCTGALNWQARRWTTACLRWGVDSGQQLIWLLKSLGWGFSLRCGPCRMRNAAPAGNSPARTTGLRTYGAWCTDPRAFNYNYAVDDGTCQTCCPDPAEISTPSPFLPGRRQRHLRLPGPVRLHQPRLLRPWANTDDRLREFVISGCATLAFHFNPSATEDGGVA